MRHFEKYRIVDLFEIQNSHNILKSDVVFGSGTIPYVTASSVNNGIVGYVDYNKSMIEKGNCIFIGGKSMTVSYQENNFFSNDSHNLILRLKDSTKRTQNIQLYLVTSLYKSLSSKYAWNDSISYRKIQSDILYLPVKKGTNFNYKCTVDDIDWDYMQERIRELEQERIRELELYLKATGLSSYVLTDEDREILEKSRKIGKIGGY